jgi:hypothetical protein
MSKIFLENLEQTDLNNTKELIGKWGQLGHLNNSPDVEIAAISLEVLNNILKEEPNISYHTKVCLTPVVRRIFDRERLKIIFGEGRNEQITNNVKEIIKDFSEKWSVVESKFCPISDKITTESDDKERLEWVLNYHSNYVLNN